MEDSDEVSSEGSQENDSEASSSDTSIIITPNSSQVYISEGDDLRDQSDRVIIEQSDE
jgi:hypothetical protein